jgi:hypothetical protein
MKRGIQQAAVSVGVFCALLVALVSFDERVHERFTELAYGAGSVASVADRAEIFVGVIASAVRHQSIEHAPLLVFAAVGVVLVAFMLRV